MLGHPFRAGDPSLETCRHYDVSLEGIKILSISAENTNKVAVRARLDEALVPRLGDDGPGAAAPQRQR